MSFSLMETLYFVNSPIKQSG
ncbi:hypothetical protein JL09_g6702, partial [Pichia kudriavzevii]